ncbi:hypothetical protein AM587_10001273 [Phytophthora nicotianae]|uniref:Uncharacterized protein n=1 Tax=Phytophthora nicotianae TaxID=4792 RepID=A0A0W8CWJ3_PHYNI|nr:hypothetical protein AM587_10001273 [Phytophthora nicotianae]KUF88447.1 hypothetical protein AM588_10001816 [Phytophthora nicotianae]
MQLYNAITLAIVAFQTSTASKTNSASDLNGWYPCSVYTFSEEGSSAGEAAECAVYSAPLCYPGICEDPKNGDSEVDIFVKRIPATVGNPDTALNVWLLMGGPGYSSTSMEPMMESVHAELEGSMNVYTMDHRGTGRSTLFDCVAAQVTTSGSPVGSEIDPSEVPACAQDLQTKFGDLRSFSVTTAATDLATFISKHTNGAKTYVYGVSYGTMFTLRLMQLAPPEVAGYVLEGISYTPGAPANKFFYTSNWDTHFGDVGETFMALCDSDSDCKTRFQPDLLSDVLQGVIEQLDNNPNSTCGELISGTSDLPPSHALRSALGTALMDSDTRTLIPPVVYRLKRCSPEDADVLTQFFTSVNSNGETKSQDSVFESPLLNNLIVYSEMTERPRPSMSKLKTRFTDSKMSSGGGEDLSSAYQYCALSKEKSALCDELNVGTYDANAIVYKRDQYWNKTVAIPNNGSVLLLSGKLDPQTPDKYAKVLLDALDGEEKELISFDYATHNGDTWSRSCGESLTVSFIRNGGNLESLDRSCLDEMPPFNLTTPDDILYSFFGTNDAYDGEYNSSLVPSS